MTRDAPGVEEALALIPGYSDARLVSRLSDGPTNASYLLEQSGEQFVLRLDKPEATTLGLDRANEKRVCEALAGAGLALPPVHFDPAAGVYLRHFVPGRAWTVSDLAAAGNLERLADLLRRLHSLTPAVRKFEPLAAAQRYAAQSGGVRTRTILSEAESRAAELVREPGAGVLCHNDLVCQNVLEGPQLMLIDWEYAAIGDAYFDLAVVVRHHDLDEPASMVLLEAYLGCEAGQPERQRLALQCAFYHCLLQLWKLRVA